MSDRVRPARPFMPLVVTPAILAAWWLVAHDSGAGWMQALGDVVFGMLLIGIIGPAVMLWRTKLLVVRAPVDAVAGQEAGIFIYASSRVRVRGIEPAAMETFLGPVGRRGRRSDQLTLVPERRGAYERLVCDVASAAPFGLQWWTRRIDLPLASPLLVAPRSGAATLPQPRSNEAEGEETERTRPDSGQPRGARPYKAGDSRRLVHWQASAHTGELMVRELESGSTTPITVQVVLPQDQDEAERVAEQAFATVTKLLQRGAAVRLRTLERSGAVVSDVGDRRSAGRRLARAIAEPHASSRTPGVEVDP